MGPKRMTASARRRGHAATLAGNDPASSSVNPRPPRGAQFSTRSAPGIVVSPYWPRRRPWVHRPRGHPVALPCTRASRIRPRSALSSRQRAACTVVARSGRRIPVVVIRLVLSWRPVARARPARGDGGDRRHPGRQCINGRASPAPRSRPVPGPARAPDMWSPLVPQRSWWWVRPRSAADVGQREAGPAQRPFLVAVVGPAPVARVEQGHRGQAQGPADDQAGVADRMQPTRRHLDDLAGPVPRHHAVGADGPFTPIDPHPGFLTDPARPDALATPAPAACPAR